jgi:hypothetical protein
MDWLGFQWLDGTDIIRACVHDGVPGAHEKEQVQSWLVRLTQKIDGPNKGDGFTPN